MENDIRNLNSCEENFGGKATGLFHLSKLGINIPYGFVMNENFI